MRKINVALIAGGWSGEREISLGSGAAVFEALDKDRYEVTWYDPREDMDRLFREREKIAVAFILLHGKFGEDGRIQGFLDILDIPYVGSGVLSCAVALNKRMAKELYRGAGLQVPESVIIRKGEHLDPVFIGQKVGLKTVVKPVAEGSSLGMSVCHDGEELARGVADARAYDDEVLIERYVPGREVTCCVMGYEELETLPLIEIVPSDKYPFFDYEAKYTPGATREICPAPIPAELAERVNAQAKTAHGALLCRGWSRTDMILQGQEIYVLETNTIPGMTETSLFPLAARTAGMSLSQLADRLIELALEGKGTR